MNRNKIFEDECDSRVSKARFSAVLITLMVTFSVQLAAVLLVILYFIPVKVCS